MLDEQKQDVAEVAKDKVGGPKLSDGFARRRNNTGCHSKSACSLSHVLDGQQDSMGQSAKVILLSANFAVQSTRLNEVDRLVFIPDH